MPPQAVRLGTPIVAHRRRNTTESCLGRLRPKRPMRMHSNVPHLPDRLLRTLDGKVGEIGGRLRHSHWMACEGNRKAVIRSSVPTDVGKRGGYCQMALNCVYGAIWRTAMLALRPVDTAAPAFRPNPITQDEAAAMFRAVLNLFGKWELTDEQAATLLDMPVRSYRRWKAEGPGRVSRDGAARLSNLMGIHKALRIVFSEAQRGYAWIKASNTAFAGSSALDVMLGGELTDIMRVRRYLDAERGGW